MLLDRMAYGQKLWPITLHHHKTPIHTIAYLDHGRVSDVTLPLTPRGSMTRARAFLCTRRDYFEVPNMGGGRREPYFFSVRAPPRGRCSNTRAGASPAPAGTDVHGLLRSVRPKNTFFVHPKGIF